MVVYRVVNSETSIKTDKQNDVASVNAPHKQAPK